MSKHIDLIAVAALLLAFAFAERIHQIMHTGFVQARVFRIRTLPRPPHLPRA
jgi:hypothetical protein